MADPLSVAGSAVGVISLALTGCNGLLQFYSSWKDCDEDAALAATRLGNLNDTLKLVESVIQNRSFPPESRKLVETRIYACRGGAEELGRKWDKVQRATPANGVSQKIDAFAKRAIYPFRKKTLEKIQRNTANMCEELGMALDVLNACVSGESTTILASLRVQTRETSSEMARISASLNDNHGALVEMKTAINDVEAGVRAINNILPEIRDKLHTTADRETAVLADISSFLSRNLQAQQELIIAESLRRQNEDTKSIINTELSTIRQVQLMIASKPSFAKEICDITFNKPDPVQQRGSMQQVQQPSPATWIDNTSPIPEACTCQAWRFRFQRSTTFLSYHIEGTIHASGCPMRLKKNRQIVAGLRFRFPRWLLSSTISASFSAVHGAGGFSLDPIFCVQSIVDVKTAPAFVAVQEFYEQLFYGTDNTNISNLTSALLKRLFELHRTGRSSPFQVNNEGANLLEYLAGCILGASWCYAEDVQDCLKLVQFLIATLQYPLTSKTIKMIIKAEYECNSYEKAIISRYLKAEYDRYRTKTLTFDEDNWGLNLVDVLQRWPDIAEDYEASPVSHAVIRRCLPTLQTLISLGHSISERVSRQSLLHLAVGWPEGLRLLISLGSDPSVVDGLGQLPLTYAFQQDCPESIKILLLANTPFAGCKGFSSRFLHSLHCCSEEAKELVVNGLAERRRSLQVQLENHLHASPLASLPNLSRDVVLDELGKPIIAMLDKPELTWTGLWDPFQPTIYHEENSWHTEILELFFSRGFQDINAYGYKGLTPLMMACSSKFGRKDDVIDWFLGKGCHPLGRDAYDISNAFHYLCRVISQKSDLSIIGSFVSSVSKHPEVPPSDYFWRWRKNSDTIFPHFTCYRPLSVLADKLKTVVKEGVSIEEIPSRKSTTLYYPESRSCGPIMSDSLDSITVGRILESRDICECFCSSRGCTATTLLFQQREQYEWITPMTITLGEWCASFKDPCAIQFIHHDYVRLKAFERLEITHTCCEIWNGVASQRVSEEERVRIHFEESELIDKLEEFMVKYEEACENLEEPVLEFVNEWVEKIDADNGDYLWRT